jgi:hypothetical protein
MDTIVRFKTWSGFILIGLVRHTDFENGCYLVQAVHEDSGEEFGTLWINFEECI